jgi:hypothetical protein
MGIECSLQSFRFQPSLYSELASLRVIEGIILLRIKTARIQELTSGVQSPYCILRRAIVKRALRPVQCLAGEQHVILASISTSARETTANPKKEKKGQKRSKCTFHGFQTLKSKTPPPWDIQYVIHPPASARAHHTTRLCSSFRVSASDHPLFQPGHVNHDGVSLFESGEVVSIWNNEHEQPPSATTLEFSGYIMCK